MNEMIELIVYDLERLAGIGIPDACVMSFYPFPKEMLALMYQRYISEEFIMPDKAHSPCDMMQVFLYEHFPEVNIVLMPMELSTAMYKIGEWWVERPLDMKMAREIHRASTLFVDFHHMIIPVDIDFEYEGRRSRNIVRISV